MSELRPYTMRDVALINEIREALDPSIDILRARVGLMRGEELEYVGRFLQWIIASEKAAEEAA